MTTRPRTVGIVGLGYRLAHLAGFRAAGCEVVALCQRNETAVRETAARHGVAGAFTRWEDMLERARPDIVAIATPPALLALCDSASAIRAGRWHHAGRWWPDERARRCDSSSAVGDRAVDDAEISINLNRKIRS